MNTKILLFVFIIISSILISAQEKIKLDQMFQSSNLKPINSLVENSNLPISNGFLINRAKIFQRYGSLNQFDYEPEKTRQIKDVSILFKKNSNNVVLIIAPDGKSLGAGILTNNKGEIITNWHVVKGNNYMHIFFYDEKLSQLKDLKPENGGTADVIAIEKNKDLAMLKLNGTTNVAPVKFGKSKSIGIGQDVFAIGHPENYIWTYTYGVISQVRNQYEWKYSPEENFKADVIQTQTPINPGNSGGPLFNDVGELIGINSFSTQSAEGLNFAVKINEIENFIAEVAKGHNKFNPQENVEEETTKINWISFDTDNNGKIDKYAADLNNDGEYDVVKVDQNEDGIIDKFQLDTNKDGYIDIEIYDKDGDSYFEYYLIDNDYDRYFDTIGVDMDKDGKPDKFYKY